MKLKSNLYKALEGINITIFSLILATLVTTVLSPFILSQRTIYRYLLTNSSLTICSSITFIILPYLLEKKRNGSVLEGFSRERFCFRALLGTLLGLPIAFSWILSFIVQYQTFPTLVNIGSIAGFEVKLTGSFISTYTMFELINQGMVSISEEILWRGVLQVKLQKGIGRMKGYLFTTLLFALAHFFSTEYTVVQALMEALLGGFIVGYLYIKTKTLTAPIFAHFTGNIIERIATLFLKF